MDYWLFSPVADKVGEGIIGAVTLGEGGGCGGPLNLKLNLAPS